jgi:twitching motility protein PilT
MHDLASPEAGRIRVYLEMAVQHKASDVHLSVGQPAIFRINGRLVSFDTPVLNEDELRNTLYEVITPVQREAFEKNRELDFSHYYFKEYFFRANLHMNKGTVAATIRIMPGALRSLDELGLPPVIAELTRRKSGLILLVGKAGSGKTTTMMHMVEVVNQERDAKIITIEDPIEYVYQSKRSLIIQREVGMDTASFAAGLKYALRQDPDVVVVGEMRDLESISMALTTAETGHLVIGTLHSSDAIEAVNRIIDVYPGDRQAQIRVQLAENLAAVVGQQLLPHKS